MKEPARERVKAFWERVGFEDIFESDTGACYWKAPSGDAGVDLPPIDDLNNLFEYAVPKAVVLLKRDNHEFWGWKGLFDLWRNNLEIGQDPALALFWVLDEVIK